MLRTELDDLFPWLIPGAQSRHVNAIGSVASPGAPATAVIVTYTVPEGMVFSLRGVAVGCNDPGALWTEGSSQLIFSLLVTSAGGTRPVEYFANLVNRVGSEGQPYPVIGRADFEENNILTWQCISDGTVTGANLFGAIVGFERPAVSCGQSDMSGGSPVR